MNLKKETLEKMAENGKTMDDIAFISCQFKENGVKELFRIDIDDFFKAADKEYDSGYGSEEVNTHLQIVFKDNSWLQREDYDGSEWWRYMKCLNEVPIKTIGAAKIWYD